MAIDTVMVDIEIGVVEIKVGVYIDRGIIISNYIDVGRSKDR